MKKMLACLIALSAMAITPRADALWTSWVSEEFGLARCSPGMAANKVHCSGSYCDQIRLNCISMPGGLDAADSYETPWVEHGGDIFGAGAIKNAFCEDGYWTTQIECMGDYCDNVRLTCTKGTRSHGKCEWAPGLWSEEQGVFPGKAGYFLAGVHCEGTHCDNKQYYICSPRAPGASCGGTDCSWSSPDGTCYCDEQCVDYGDCCADRNVFCGG